MLALALFLCAQDAAPVAAGDAAEAGGALRILVVAKPGESEARVEDVYAGLRAAGLLPVELEERAGVDRPPPPPSPKGTHDAARAALGTARAKLRDLDVDAVRTAADVAVDEVLRMERPEDGIDILDDALLLKANIALQAGLEDEARRSLVLVARLDPDRTELNAGLYPPSLVDAYTAARATSAAAPPATLVVTPRVASFAAAEVSVDGRPRTQPAPLSAGPHLVIVRARGDITAAKIVELDDKAPVVFAPFLAPPDAAQERARLTAEAARAADDVSQTKALSALAKLCAARAVLFVAGSHAALWSARGLQPLVVQASAPGSQLGLATLSALQAPVRGPADDGIDPVVVAVLSGGAVVVAGLVGASLWALWPASPPPPPHRPVFVSCCVD